MAIHLKSRERLFFSNAVISFKSIMRITMIKVSNQISYIAFIFSNELKCKFIL